MSAIKSPTFIFEGGQGNDDAMGPLRRASGSAPVKLVGIAGGTHFSVLAPISVLLAKKIADEARGGLAVTVNEDEAHTEMLRH